MSDLDDLEDIAETFSFGHRPHNTGRGAANKKAYRETCAKGHARTGTNVTYGKNRGRVRVVCRICQQEYNRECYDARRLLRASSKQEPSRT
jgi:hypothetical protein